MRATLLITINYNIPEVDKDYSLNEKSVDSFMQYCYYLLDDSI